MDPAEEGLDRFLRAQDSVGDAPLREIEAGRKRTHWMWFVLPQLAGLGLSDMSRRYAIRDLAEARDYLSHPVLGPRLRAMVTAALPHAGAGARALFGSPDDQKFRSCLTLFAVAAPEDPLFGEALAAFFGGVPDARTLAAMRSAG